MNNNVFKTFLALLGGIFLGFGLAIIFLYETDLSRTGILIILITSLILGGFILGSLFLRRTPKEESNEPKEEENSDDSGDKGV
ncbi:MAG: hypothetical protein PHY30_03765 [Candidatus Pacebacteria bacterium]|nr:hypothetical protein [Candidatus Paceibacterota bacterium]